MNNIAAKSKLRHASAAVLKLQFYCFGVTVASMDKIACFQVICFVLNLRIKGI